MLQVTRRVSSKQAIHIYRLRFSQLRDSRLVTPIFLFSLPRSGSTLLQRIVGAHPEVSTVSEPWILLPQLYARRYVGAMTEYRHELSVRAIEDFSATLPRGSRDYEDELRTFALRLYTKASNDGSVYFLDKTPRYHLIVDEIIDLFPDAKFVFLWRNPLAVIASIINTFGNGQWNVFRYEIDVVTGLRNLVSAWQREQQRSFALHYEDLVRDPLLVCDALFDYLSLKSAPGVVEEFGGVQLTGMMGDPGTRRHNTEERIRSDRVDGWEESLANPARRAWCRLYLRKIGDDVLRPMGYDRTDLLKQLHRAPGSRAGFLGDLGRMAYGIGYKQLDGLMRARNAHYSRGLTQSED